MAEILLIYENVFAKSKEVQITAQKKPTKIDIYLYNETETERMENKTVYVGTKIIIKSALFWIDEYGGLWTLAGKPHDLYHKLNDGPWKLVSRCVTGPETNTCRFEYTLKEAGTHYFYVEFPGDAEYEGCRQQAKTLAR